MTAFITENLYSKFLNIVASIKMVRLGIYDEDIVFESMKYDVDPSFENRTNFTRLIANYRASRSSQTNHIMMQALVFDEYLKLNSGFWVELFTSSHLDATDINNARNIITIDLCQVFTQCYINMSFLGFTEEDVLNFILNIDDRRISLLAKQTSAMCEAMAPAALNKNLRGYESNPNLEQILSTLLNPDLGIQVIGNISKWWEHNDLVTNKFKRTIAVHARFLRLQFLYGSLITNPKEMEFKKLFNELELRKIINGSSVSILQLESKFLQKFESEIDLYNIAELQIDSQLPISNFSPPRQDYQGIYLNHDAESLQKVLEELKREGMIDTKSSAVALGLALLEDEWPVVASDRILNVNFQPQDYVSLQNSFYHNAQIHSANHPPVVDNHVKLGVIEGTAGILLTLTLLCCLYQDTMQMRSCWAKQIGVALRRFGLLKPAAIDQHHEPEDTLAATVRKNV